MKQGGHRKVRIGYASSAARWSGFTIVETLIVLAVTGALLISAIILINGRQAKTEFQTGVNDFQQQMQDVVNQAAQGFYPNDGNFFCDSTTSPVTLHTVSGTGQGANGGCIFLGDLLQFAPNTNTYTLVPIAGNQYVSGVSSVDVASAKPVAATQLGAPSTMNGGLTYVKTLYNGANVANANGFGFMTGDASGNFATPTSNGLASGTRQFSIYIIPNTNSGILLNSYPATGSTSHLLNVSDVSVCVTGGINESALITIGSAGGLDVSTDIHVGNTTCS